MDHRIAETLGMLVAITGMTIVAVTGLKVWLKKRELDRHRAVTDPGGRGVGVSGHPPSEGPAGHPSAPDDARDDRGGPRITAEESGEIVWPDPGARRRALGLLAGITVAGGILIVTAAASRNPVLRWVLEEPDRAPGRLRILLMAAAGVMAIPLLGASWWLKSVASRIDITGRFPLPDMRVVRPTPVLAGQDARRRARTFRVMALALTVLAGAVTVVMWGVGSIP